MLQTTTSCGGVREVTPNILVHNKYWTMKKNKQLNKMKNLKTVLLSF